MNSTPSRPPSLWLGLVVVLCVNPVALLIIGWHPVLALLSPLPVILATQLLWRRFGHGAIVVYTVNFLLLAGVWVNAEAVVRARYHGYVMEDLYEQHGTYYTNRRNLRTVLHDKEYNVDYLTNADGYRIGFSQDPARTVEHADWLFLGDSYTQGAQVPFETLYTTQLFRRYPDRIVLNSGLSGWGLYESLEFLKARGARLQPKMVFVQISNFNDFMKVELRHAGFSDYLMQESEAVRLALQNFKYLNPTDLPLGRWVEPFYTSESDNRRYNVFYRGTSREKEADLAEVSAVLRAIAQQCQAIGAQLVLVQVPTKEQVSFRFLEEVVTGLHINPRLLDLEFPNRLVRHLADSLGVRVVDPLADWRRAPVFPFFQYDEHLNATGHEMLARAVAGAIDSMGLTTATRILSTSYAGDRYPQFTPGGDSIVFHSFRDGNFELLKADTASWTEERLTTDDATETHPILLPGRGGMVFVVGDAASGTTRLWRSDADAKHPVPLFPPDSAYGAIPAAFPDGQSIVFPSWGPSPEARSTRLMRFFLADGRTAQLPQAVLQVWRPTVHPSGRYVAYIGQEGKQYDLYELDLVTSKSQRLTTTSYDEWDPTYTPDGRNLIYAARADGNWDLFRMDRALGTVVRLTKTTGDEWDPQVSPDGKTLAYGGEFGLMRGIYVMPLRP